MKKILIVEGNLREENKSFSENGIQTHTESLKDSLSHLLMIFHLMLLTLLQIKIFN